MSLFKANPTKDYRKQNCIKNKHFSRKKQKILKIQKQSGDKIIKKIWEIILRQKKKVKETKANLSKDIKTLNPKEGYYRPM